MDTTGGTASIVFQIIWTLMNIYTLLADYKNSPIHPHLIFVTKLSIELVYT